MEIHPCNHIWRKTNVERGLTSRNGIQPLPFVIYLSLTSLGLGAPILAMKLLLFSSGRFRITKEMAGKILIPAAFITTGGTLSTRKGAGLGRDTAQAPTPVAISPVPMRSFFNNGILAPRENQSLGVRFLVRALYRHVIMGMGVPVNSDKKVSRKASLRRNRSNPINCLRKLTKNDATRCGAIPREFHLKQITNRK